MTSEAAHRATGALSFVGDVEHYRIDGVEDRLSTQGRSTRSSSNVATANVNATMGWS